MLDFNDFAIATISDLKAFAGEHAIVPQGDRRRLDTWREAVQAWVESQAKPAIEAVVTSTKAAAAKAQEVATSPQALENYTRILSVTRYLGEQLVVGCEYGLRVTVWGIAYAVTLATWLIEQSVTEAAWSPIDRADVPVKELPSSEMLEQLPVHGPAIAAEVKIRQAAELKEAIASTDTAISFRPHPEKAPKSKASYRRTNGPGKGSAPSSISSADVAQSVVPRAMSLL
jgi:hypothetical protein